MNRIKLGPLANLPAPESRQCIQPTSQSSCVESTDFEHSLFIPMHYEPNHRYPLIVWLHDHAHDQRQLLNVMPQISTRNYLGVSCCGSGLDDAQSPSWLQSSDAIETASARVDRIIDLAMARFSVNSQRIFIAGVGNGGTMAFRLAFQRPDLFAGVASLNGSLPCNLTPLANWMRCRKIPIFWAHGRQSGSFPENNLCHQLRLLHVAGFSVTLRQYPAHEEIPAATFLDLNQWIMEQLSLTGEHNIVK